MKKILITGSAGFIGFNFSLKLLKKNYEVIGIDNYDDYYSVKLKKNRIQQLKKFKNFKFYHLDITDKDSFKILKKYKFTHIFHFAAQAGVRYSVINPVKYINTNILGTINLLEFVKLKKPESTFFASSSSIYGDSKKFPLSEKDLPSPKNIYASSKIINEISARTFSKKHNLKIYGLRFFTIYGEWGRPDMLLFKMLSSAFKKTILNLNNEGKHYRDFTYINDVTEIMYLLMKVKLKAKYDIFNVCSNNPQYVKTIISNFKKNYGKLFIKNIPKNNLDVFKTHGNNTKIKKILKFSKFTSFESGFLNTYKWYKKYYNKLID